nr:MAG TPA: hypothetical protein [Caudoviricetes sp.]
MLCDFKMFCIFVIQKRRKRRRILTLKTLSIWKE